MPVTVRKGKANVEDRVRVIRAAFSLSQEALARALGVSSRTVARWEEGTASPSPLALVRLQHLNKIREKARRLFQGKEADAWLRTPNPALRGYSPVEQLRAPGGLEEVADLLGRIEWDLSTSCYR
ncbi:antitoxin Xre/MbcA/ParS toxin-binding domain-containing protein [Candidatus Methylomirabilis sp.]|uniref:antitoxin Xre/MbcA/ParS toxin-binding domain-containing protein n=1 Tax=Candidatus Methylomirabilis sp. TaxID=2032687 RepID=UPI0030765B23